MTMIQSISNNNLITTSQTSTQNSTSKDFASYMEVPTSLYDIFEKASKTYNVPLDLLMAVGKAESSYRTDAVSPHGAQGVMQLMPATAAELGVTDSFDPEQNIMGGAKYLSQMLEKFNGDATLACAAYNAGANNVEKYNGVPPFEETQKYVKIIADYRTQGVSAPTDAISTSYQAVSNPSTINSTAENTLEDLFSYDDYLRFLEIYLNQILNSAISNSAKKDTDSETTLAYQNIKYNNSVMNLIKNIDTI